MQKKKSQKESMRYAKIRQGHFFEKKGLVERVYQTQVPIVFHLIRRLAEKNAYINQPTYIQASIGISPTGLLPHGDLKMHLDNM